MGRKDRSRGFRYFNLVLSFGITLVLAMLFGYWGGSYLDLRLGTDPWLALTGIFLGVVTGFRYLVRELLKEVAQEESRNDRG